MRVLAHVMDKHTYTIMKVVGHTCVVTCIGLVFFSLLVGRWTPLIDKMRRFVS